MGKYFEVNYLSNEVPLIKTRNILRWNKENLSHITFICGFGCFREYLYSLTTSQTDILISRPPLIKLLKYTYTFHTLCVEETFGTKTKIIGNKTIPKCRFVNEVEGLAFWCMKMNY